MVEGVEPADDRPLVQEQPDAVPELEAEASISLSNPNSSAFGQTLATWSVVTPGRISSIERVDPLACPLVGVALRIARRADDERPVVAGLVADERLDDVEERLVAGPDEPVGEHVRVRDCSARPTRR